MAPLKIAVMGAGLIGKSHVERILAERRTVLCAVIDPSDIGRDFAASKGATWHTTFAEAAANERPDGVIIATPNQLHVANAMEVIKAGIPVLVEKPIADDAGAAAMLVDAGERAGVPILVGHHRRHNPMIQAAKRVLEGGRLGKVLTAHGSFWVAKPDDYFDVAWRRRAGAGPTFINLIHDVDLFRYFFGEVESVHAMESNSARDHAVEDTAVVLLRFSSGVLGTLNASDAVASPWSWEMTAGENPAFPRQDQTCYQIGGTGGSLAIPQLALWTNASKPDWLERLVEEHVPFTPADPLAAQLKHFCDVIRGSAEPLVSGREGLATLRVIEAIKSSARSGQTIRLTDADMRRGH
ncbi:Gfo/Idh/MocA family oxidoreductase [Rhizobium sp. P32RR-XVIII]|uniref:Gfo/Idh/MocA family protein n=1 Tax=Rhizobium sp. P32RR-XVIII TaxID=2726738 RepID=UPI0014574110|nr:Gfo/Idh/MocA family oxidoreductase [Rhizobium sp. P32RR-XVIII]NLS03970.1 Gfo/Idh/MocA family oxidoreductase [Rhizobium sp. P32RR-XVIII]